MLLSFLEKGGVLCITILPQGLPTISNRIFPNTSLPTLSPPLLSLLCSSIVAKGQEFKVKVKVKCFFFSFSIMSQISAARAAKMALQNINPNVATGHFNRKASPTPVLLDPNLAHANVNADDDDASLDDNSVAEPDTERMIFGAEVAGLSEWKIFDRGTCRKVFEANNTSYICGGVHKKCRRQVHNAAIEDDRHPPVAARQVKVRANAKLIDGDVFSTATIEQYVEQSQIAAENRKLQRQTAMQSPGFKASMAQMGQTPTAGKNKTVDSDDEDDNASFKSLKQQAATMNSTLDKATRAALATPPAKRTSNGPSERDSIPDPAIQHLEFRRYMDAQQKEQSDRDRRAEEQQRQIT